MDITPEGKLTKEQHRLRAKLMGMRYSPRTNTYTPDFSFVSQRIDADTLEPLTIRELNDRVVAAWAALPLK